MSKHASAANDWAAKVVSLIKGGNVAGAVTQIKASANLKDVQQLRKQLDAGKLVVIAPAIESAVGDQLHALGHPRLSRSP